MGNLLWISRRLQLSQKGSRTSMTGIVIAVLGVSLALMIMLCTIAVVLGFKHQITERILGFDGKVTVLPAYDYVTGESQATLTLDSAMVASIRQVLPDARISPRYRQPGMLKTSDDFAGIYIDGFDDSHDFAFQRSAIVEGRYPGDVDSVGPDAMEIMISRPLARTLNLKCGESVNAYFFVNEAVKTRKFAIVGLYETGFSEYDNTVGYAPIATLRRIGAVDSLQATQLDIDVPGIDGIEDAAARLQQHFIDQYHRGDAVNLYPVDNVKHTGAAFFSWLSLLDTNVVVIFILMACVAGFTLVSSMFIIILNRIPTIGILRALGTTRRQIRLIFINIAMKAVGIGMIIGNVVSLALIIVQQRTEVLRLDPEMYYLNAVPVEINIPAWIAVNIGVVVVAWLLLILPSRAAAKINPATTMRYQ